MELGNADHDGVLHFLHWEDNFVSHATDRVGSWFHDQGWNPCLLQWECGVLTTGPPWKFWKDIKKNKFKVEEKITFKLMFVGVCLRKS